MILPFYFSGCSSAKFITANPPGMRKPSEQPEPQTKEEQTPEPDTAIIEKKSLEPDDLDFAMALIDSTETGGEKLVRKPTVDTSDKKPISKPSSSSSRKPLYKVPATKARIALVRNKLRYSLYSVGMVMLKGIRKKDHFSFRGRLSIDASSTNNRIIISAGPIKRREVALPCTLLSKKEYNFVELDDGSYRGSMIIVSEKKKRFSIINFINVEEYLRGVVPLEIGKRGAEDIEAVKAQAVAARTYTYKKIMAKRDASFDMVATVADQVYGGMNAEHRLCDKAIRLTKDLVMAYKDSLIFAYYHSTCGGRTANIEDVWEKKAQHYLRSIKDVSKDGNAYCSISNYFTWNESWPTGKLSSIVTKYGGNSGCRGTIKGMKIKWRYSCGRISSLKIHSSRGDCQYSGDKIRFVLRRNLKGHPILRSSNFRILSGNSSSIRIEGRGYGHGVGMCQMGAIGRAGVGQKYDDILKAYYKDIELRTVTIN